ncbi:MAG: ubiquinone biosynthesis regulatory protein kinase UbiB [Legionellales bacterium]|nr:ubiquinone biosynthesis regulatory protein kinase UbiB [Legionellales bacterium]
MSSLKQVRRFLYINYVLAQSGLDRLLVSFPYFAAFRFVVYLNPWNWFRTKPFQRGVALRETFEKLGPIFIKFGQALSTRPDIVPADMMAELSKLRDSVPPFSSEQVISMLEKTYGQSPFTMFDGFDATPLASASIAQVHTAYLKTGESVVIKILRPNIREIIDRDLAILKKMAQMLDRHWWGSKYLKPKDLVAEFERNLLDELDLQREAANATQLKRNFQDSSLLYVPKIYWDYVHKNVLVLERIHGVSSSDLEQLLNHGVNLKSLAERGLHLFFTQVFRDCFFHADMHPGNVFVSTENPENPQYICVDFGIMGTLDASDKRYLAENLYAFFNRDYRRIAILHVESGWVAPHTRIEEFESAIRTVCEPIFEKPLKDISFAQLILQLLQVGRRFHMEIQPQLMLLQKVEGLGRHIYPDLNIWVAGKPFIERWLRDQMGPKAFFKHMRENIPFIIEDLPYMPRLLNDVLSRLKDPKVSTLRPVDSPAHDRGFLRGVSIGVFLAMTLVLGLHYGQWLQQNELMMFVMGAAVTGGCLALIKPSSRSKKWD